MDHYEVLGVQPDARHTEIRTAYRRLMREHHPDLRPGDPSAEEMTRRVTAAWAVLGRPSVRAAYDRTRAARRTPVAPRLRPEGPIVPAYSPAGRDYRRSFHVASVKVATAVLLAGIVILLLAAR